VAVLVPEMAGNSNFFLRIYNSEYPKLDRITVAFCQMWPCMKDLKAYER
jgi:hypothetical protein